LIAIKKLFSPDEKEFEKEVDILKTLGSKSHPHPHLIKLLATYRQNSKYHLMFPWAAANLRQYWDARPSPVFDRATVLWSMKQMAGIANALLVIHEFKVTIPLSVNGPGGKRVQKDVELSVQKGEAMYGRHGDIKPENIMWFDKTPECSDERGILQISDFGLGRFHGRDSRSNVNPDTIMRSPTYEPPECKLRRPVSRAYDLWSLGCLYLEFATWLLMGATDVVTFSEFRGQEDSAGINNDNYFTVHRDPITGPEAVVRDRVIMWVDKLHRHEKCSGVMHDLLELTMNHLLVVESSSRWSANDISWEMKQYLKRAETDAEYLLKAVPSTPKRTEGGRSKSTSNVMDPPKPLQRQLSEHEPVAQLLPGKESDNEKKNETENEKLLPLPVKFFKSKDLVGRAAATPGMQKGKSVTWPQALRTTDEGG
jgi:serine/threonine protein kinase